MTYVKKDLEENIGELMFDGIKTLFPIYRSITGNGVRETLRIIKNIIPIDIKEVPSGTKAFDWTIPDEWNIRDAFIKDSSGKKIVDFKKNNLHVVGYSVPFRGIVESAELKKHIFSLPDKPDWIPYVTSYYKRTWGFCVSQNVLDQMKDDFYEVVIDSDFNSKGSLTYGEIIINKAAEKEILLSTNICHPSMASNELSGPIVATYIAKKLLDEKKLKYRYRILFIPETIGSIFYISKHLNELKKSVIAGYVLTCLGDNNVYSYLSSRKGNCLVDRVTNNILNHVDKNINVIRYPFTHRGSDERQYCSPGVDLPIGSLTRSKYMEYDEYHTSADNLSFISKEGLKGSLDMYLECISAIENNGIYETTTMCEPFLSSRGMCNPTSRRGSVKNKDMVIRDILAYCDGENSILDIADIINKNVNDLFPTVNELLENGLLREK